jgi:bisphosphoglycerate-dependent phosphoglycerate mutase
MNEETRERSERWPFENMGRRVDEQMNEAAERVEEELKRVIAYLNDRVVPEVRQNGSKALRAAAEQLTKLAEHLDSRRGQ